MGSAIGTSANGPPSSRDHGPRWVDIRDYGARPAVSGGPTYASTNRAAIQAAIDSFHVATSGSTAGGIVYIPTGDYFIDRPLFLDDTNVGLRGDGPYNSRILAVGAQDIVICGVSRKPSGVALTTDHFVDLFSGGSGGIPMLDTSAVTASGQRWGLRTKADCHVVQQGGAMDLGLRDAYKTVRQLTIDYAIDFTNSPGSPVFPNNSSLMGFTELGKPMPWVLYLSNGKMRCDFRTAAPGIDAGTYWSFTFWNMPAKPGLYRFTIQIDLVNAQICAYVDGQQVATSPMPAGFNAAANLVFLQNQHYPFGLGSTSPVASAITDYFGGPIDCTFCGLKLTGALVYNNSGTGTIQTRIDGQVLNDSRRYFTYDGPQVIGWLPLTDLPSQVAQDRLVSISCVTAGGFPTTAFFLDNVAHGSPNGTTQPGAIRDLSLYCTSTTYGRCITTGFTAGLVVQNCQLLGGHQGIGSLNIGSNYPVTITDCSISGADAAIYLNYASLVQVLNCNFPSAFRCGVRLVDTTLTMERAFFAGIGMPDYVVKGVRSSYDVSHMINDSESLTGGPQIAMFYCSGALYNPLGSMVNLRNIGTGALGPGAALVILDDTTAENGEGARPSYFSMESVGFNDGLHKSAVRVIGPGSRWRASFPAETTQQRLAWVDTTSTAGSVVSRHTYFTGPPRDGIWNQNAHILDVPSPAIGQYTRWRCMASGAYGSATPPTWMGFQPIDDGLALAAYVSDHSYWAVSGSPAGSLGYWTNAVFAQTLNALFGGTMPALRTGLYAALGTRTAQRLTGLTFEVSGGGYARVSMPSGTWGTSSGGTVANAQPVNFPTATGAWKDLSGFGTASVLLIYDAAVGGNLLATVDIAPINLVAGITPSLAAGAISINRAALSPQGSYAATVHDQLNNFWLNRTAFTAPTIYVALSTAPASIAASPAEPAAGGYARVVTTVASWTPVPTTSFINIGPPGTTAVISNAASLAFPAPSAGWGTVKSVYLMDAASGGNVLAAANLTVARTIAAGDPARSFAPGALWLCRS